MSAKKCKPTFYRYDSAKLPKIYLSASYIADQHFSEDKQCMKNKRNYNEIICYGRNNLTGEFLLPLQTKLLNFTVHLFPNVVGFLS